MVIDFPKEEHKALKAQFEKYGFAYTTRVSDEIGKYTVGQIFEVPWNRRVRVSEITAYESLEDHPHLDEISEEQKRLISKYDTFEYIKLDYV